MTPSHQRAAPVADALTGASSTRAHSAQLHAPDWILAAAVATLVIFGLVMVYSTTYPWKPGEPMWYLVRQAAFAGVGLILLLVMMRLPYRLWQRLSVPLLGATILTLIILLVVGAVSMGATRWLLNGSLQPSEIGKLFVIIYVADWLTSKGQQIRHVSLGLVPFSILIGVITGLIMLQPNFSTACLIAITAFILFYIAGAEVKQLIAGGMLGTLAAILLIYQAPYRMRRIAMFMDPLSDPDGLGYHITRALAALNTGGLFGVGLGHGPHKYESLLPAPHTDSIVALIGEELGLFGIVGILILFAIIAFRGYQIARNAPDRFSTFLAAGITVSLTIQAMINVAVITSTAPFTGVPLPFISYGGSSLVSSLASVGLLLNISRYRRAAEKTSDAPAPVGRRYGRPRVSGAGSSQRSAI